MPSQTRERGPGKGPTTKQKRAPDDEFVLFLQGIPAHCRWQELKDLIRQTALHIRQAVVYDDHHGLPTGLGQIIVKNEDEAWRTYHRLSINGWDGQALVVTLARTSSPTQPIAGPTKSAAPCVSSRGYAAGYSTASSSRLGRNLMNFPFPASPMAAEIPTPVIPASPPYQPGEYAPMFQGPMNNMAPGPVPVPNPLRPFAHLQPLPNPTTSTTFTDPLMMHQIHHCFSPHPSSSSSTTFDPLLPPVGPYLYPPQFPMQPFRVHEVASAIPPFQSQSQSTSSTSTIQTSSGLGFGKGYNNTNNPFYDVKGAGTGVGTGAGAVKYDYVATPPTVGSNIPDPRSLDYDYMYHYHQQHPEQQEDVNSNNYSHPPILKPQPPSQTQIYQPQLEHERTISIQNLNPTTTTETLKFLFHHDQNQSFTIEHCEIHPSPLSHHIQKKAGLAPVHSHARIVLGTPEEAKHAVLSYDNTIFMGARIRVILPSFPPPPHSLATTTTTTDTIGVCGCNPYGCDSGEEDVAGEIINNSTYYYNAGIEAQSIESNSNGPADTIYHYARDDCDRGHITGSVNENKSLSDSKRNSESDGYNNSTDRPENSSNKDNKLDPDPDPDPDPGPQKKPELGPESETTIERKQTYNNDSHHHYPLIINGSGIGVGNNGIGHDVCTTTAAAARTEEQG